MVEAAEGAEVIEPEAVVELDTPETEALDEEMNESETVDEAVDETIVEAVVEAVVVAVTLEDEVTEPVAVEKAPEVVEVDEDAALVAITPS